MIISDRDLKSRLIRERWEVEQGKEWWGKGEWDKIGNKIIIDPFNPYALGPCCYSLSVGDEYVSLRDPENPKPLKEGEYISIGPSETMLILTQEYICLPRNILAMVVPRATWIFEGSSLSATRIDPTWYGRLLIGFTNLAKNPVALEHGEEFCTCYFMQATETEKVLTRETQPSLGRERIGRIKFVHAKQQRLLLPDRVAKEDIDKVVELYGWPWDVVRGILYLSKKEIGEWIEKEVTSDIVAEATSAAVRTAFDQLQTQAEQQTRWVRNLTIALITVLGALGAAIIGAFITYLLTKFT